MKKVLCLYRVRREYPVRKRWTNESVVVFVRCLSDVPKEFETAVEEHRRRELDRERVPFVEFELTGFIPEQKGGL